MANSVNPDQIALELIWVNTACTCLSFMIFKSKHRCNKNQTVTVVQPKSDSDVIFCLQLLKR